MKKDEKIISLKLSPTHHIELIIELQKCKMQAIFLTQFNGGADVFCTRSDNIVQRGGRSFLFTADLNF
jgi:hypothetical protein